ncbi:beta-1,3-galactosyltransferase 5-like [Hypanus sabinus]|uniref:beta-1,3-galactosyltransferase 5-like n=1 Tax=Hypanus sabinus TaxID=79690 RepID=UPI0028C3D2F9|nr:beta-1,3-galactosyltransferase 5-like [Hypanus sabinus]
MAPGIQRGQGSVTRHRANKANASFWLRVFPKGIPGGNRFLKAGILLQLLLCLIPVALWSRERSGGSFRPRCPSRLNGTSFLTRPAGRCDDSAPFLVLLVPSSPDEFEARSVIRQTWGSERRFGGARAVTYFLLGHGRDRQDSIRREAAEHRDIIQGDFSDTYYNLTLKVLLGLEWICCYCRSPSFVMKTDTDTFVNTDYLLELLSRAPRSNLLTGLIHRGAKPYRGTKNRWYISKEEYPGKTYPPYCAGSGYVLSTDLACRVWNISGTPPLFRLEDVYVGMRVAELKVEPVPIHTERVFSSYREPFSICSYRRLVTSHHVRNFEKLLYWKALQDSVGEGCPGDP